MSIVALLPNADGNTAWATTGASRFGVVSDNSDATYISSPSANLSVYQALEIGTTTLTATQRIKAIQFIQRSQFMSQGYVQLRFISFGQLASKAALTGQRATAGAIGTSTSAWFTTDAKNNEWKQSTLDTLQLRLFGCCGAGAVRVHELDINVDVRNQPTLATLTVTGNTTSSRPTVTWVYADSDGDPQNGWQAKAFTAAQYGAAGFDPATSPNSWSSGEVLNDAQNTTVTTDLINGVTYKLYVKVAKDFNGARWYSDWVPSAAFTMGFEPLPTPTLTVTPDPVVPHLRNQIVVDSKMNLLTANDASFETGLGSWAAVANCAIVTSATQALKGAQSMRMTATAGATDMTASTPGGAFGYPIGPNRSYTILEHFRAGTTGRQCRVEAAQYDGAGVQIGGTLTGSNITDTNAGFTQAILTFTSAVNAAYLLIQTRVLIPGAGEQHYADAFSLSTSSSTTWFTGGVSQIDSQLVEFADLSPQHSVVANLLNSQLASGGELQNNADGFFTRSSKDLLTFDRSLRVDGEGCLRWDVGNNTGSFLDLGNANGTFDPFMTYMPPCVPGTQYTFSLYVQAGTGTHSLRAVLNSIDGTGAIVGSSTNGSTNATIAQAWQRLTVTHTAQTGAVGLRPSLENINGDLVPYFLDSLQLEEGATASTWHQGQGQVPAWQPVRGAKTALMADVRTNLAVCFDREAPPGVIRLYRATNTVAYADGTTGVGPVSTMVPTKLPIPTDTYILKDPEQPAHDLVITIRAGNLQIVEDTTTYHPVRPNAIGPEGFGQRPVVASDWIGGQDGQMELQVWDEDDWYRLQQLLQSKRALLLQLAEGGQRYIRFTDRSWPMERIGPVADAAIPSRYLRVVAASFAHVARPAVLS